MSLKKENILVVPADQFAESLLSNRFSSDFDLDKLSDLLLGSELHMRYLMEEDPSYKQIIPYVVVADESNRILTYQRSSKGGEGRLHNMYSIGVGGHLDENVKQKITGIDLFFDGMIREIQEELGHEASKEDLSIFGSIYDDSNDVGLVHFGVVTILRVHSENFTNAGETDILVDREFLSLDELALKRENLENWSQIALDVLHHRLGE